MLEPIYSTTYSIKPGDLLCFKFPIEQYFILKDKMNEETLFYNEKESFVLLFKNDIVMVIENNFKRTMRGTYYKEKDEVVDGFIAMTPNCQLIWCSIQDLENFKKIKK